MPVFGGISASNITTGAQSRLMTLRLALQAADDYYLWLSGYSTSDLVTAGIASTADAQDLLNAFADAHELSVLANGGGLNAYTLPYNFLTSMRVVIGPQF